MEQTPEIEHMLRLARRRCEREAFGPPWAEVETLMVNAYRAGRQHQSCLAEALQREAEARATMEWVYR